MYYLNKNDVFLYIILGNEKVKKTSVEKAINS